MPVTKQATSTKTRPGLFLKSKESLTISRVSLVDFGIVVVNVLGDELLNMVVVIVEKFAIAVDYSENVELEPMSMNSYCFVHRQHDDNNMITILNS